MPPATCRPALQTRMGPSCHKCFSTRRQRSSRSCWMLNPGSHSRWESARRCSSSLNSSFSAFPRASCWDPFPPSMRFGACSVMATDKSTSQRSSPEWASCRAVRTTPLWMALTVQAQASLETPVDLCRLLKCLCLVSILAAILETSEGGLEYAVVRRPGQGLNWTNFLCVDLVKDSIGPTSCIRISDLLAFAFAFAFALHCML